MNITLTREEAQQVLDALIDAADSQNWEMQQNIDQHGEWYRRSRYLKQAVAKSQETIETLRARLAQPEPKPVAWIKKDRSSIEVSIMSAEYMRNEGFEPLYTAPPQREWQGLTDEEIMEMLDYGQYGNVPQYARNFVDAIEAKLKEKNT
jgi:hypothetical protein